MSTPLEKRIRMTTFICQLTGLLCCVSILYLTKSVYMPAHRTLNSGFSEDPVMCSTVSNIRLQNCKEMGCPTWSSCETCCLFSESYASTQIRVNVRRNGSQIRLEECDPTTFRTKYCREDDPKLETYECIHGECASLRGIFDCAVNGPVIVGAEVHDTICKNLTSLVSCECSTTDSPINCNTSGTCLHLYGRYECSFGDCYPVRNCEERCIDINIGQNNVIIREGDNIHMARCARARDIVTETEIWPNEFRSINQPNRSPMLMMDCTTLVQVSQDNTTYSFSDCFNGMLLEPDHFGNKTNITHDLTNHNESMRLLDDEGRFAPPEQELLIYNATPLYINHDACVSALLDGECSKFFLEYGRDGTYAPAGSQSRFQCYYNPYDSNFVLLRFNRDDTKRDVMIYVGVPVALAIVSGFMCILRRRIISSGDELRWPILFRCCGSDGRVVQE